MCLRADIGFLEILTFEEGMRLLRVAHRLQANNIVLRLGRHMLLQATPIACLFICTEFGLDDLLREVLESEQARRIRDTNRLPRNPRDPAVPPADLLPEPLDDNIPGGLANSFIKVVMDFDIKLPFDDAEWPLSLFWRLHLATARDRVSAARRDALDRHVIEWPNTDWSGMDVLQFIHLSQTTQTDSGLHALWDEKIARGKQLACS